MCAILENTNATFLIHLHFSCYNVVDVIVNVVVRIEKQNKNEIKG